MSDMSIEQIIRADVEKNHSGTGVTYERMMNMLNRTLREGFRLVRAGNTLFLFKDAPQNGVEFHAINPESGDKLIENTAQFGKKMKAEGKIYLLAYFDNPKIVELVERGPFESHVEKVDLGPNRTYRAIMRL